MVKFPEEKTKGDYGLLAAKMVVSAIPSIGGPVAELIGLINTPLEKRKIDWLNDIAERLKRVEDKNKSFSFESLSANQEFITIFIHATQIAIRSHEKEKLDALRNAVLNTAQKVGVRKNLDLMFLSYVDQMTPWHIIILKFFQDPNNICSEKGMDLSTRYHMGRPANLLEDAFDELKGKRDLYDLIYNELSSKGLVVDGGLHVMSTFRGMCQKRTTLMGDDFLKFIGDE